MEPFIILGVLKDTPAIEGVESPFGIYLTLYRALIALEDDRAHPVLAEAYARLQQCASAINDEEMRHSFLQQVFAHRQIVAEFQAIGSE